MQRADLKSLLQAGRPLLMPGVHDALGARLAEDAGFSAVSVGGAALAAVQLGLPDVGLQSFGEYVETLRRIAAATRLPVMVDGENGFGDVKAVTRTMRVFEQIGLAGVAIEDLRFPPVLGARPAVVPLEEIGAKLSAALAARQHDTTWVIGRTDAALVQGLDEGLARIRHYEALGVDAVLLTGLADLDAMRRVRDAVRCPVVALVVEGGPWVAPTPAQVAAVGFEMVVYPATLMLRAATALREGLAAIAQGDVGLPAGSLGYAGMAQALRVSEWAAIDAQVLPAG